jgi:hypothetical protein
MRKKALNVVREGGSQSLGLSFALSPRAKALQPGFAAGLIRDQGRLDQIAGLNGASSFGLFNRNRIVMAPIS